MTVSTDPAQFSVKIRDESVPRSDVVEALLALSSSNLTARELISERVRMEVDRRLISLSGAFAPVLVIPSDEEQRLNGPHDPDSVPVFTTQTDTIDAEQQVEVALVAFENNSFVLLVDDLQVESLDAQIDMTPDTVVTFLKLTPLVGG